MKKVYRNGTNEPAQSLYYLQIAEPMEISAPTSSQLNQDDLLIKFMYQTNDEEPTILCLQIKEPLGSFGDWGIIYEKFKATQYDEELPQKILDWALEINQRRAHLGW